MWVGGLRVQSSETADGMSEKLPRQRVGRVKSGWWAQPGRGTRSPPRPSAKGLSQMPGEHYVNDEQLLKLVGHFPRPGLLFPPFSKFRSHREAERGVVFLLDAGENRGSQGLRTVSWDAKPGCPGPRRPHPTEEQGFSRQRVSCHSDNLALCKIKPLELSSLKCFKNESVGQPHSLSDSSALF